MCVHGEDDIPYLTVMITGWQEVRVKGKAESWEKGREAAMAEARRQSMDTDVTASINQKHLQ